MTSISTNDKLAICTPCKHRSLKRQFKDKWLKRQFHLSCFRNFTHTIFTNNYITTFTRQIYCTLPTAFTKKKKKHFWYSDEKWYYWTLKSRALETYTLYFRYWSGHSEVYILCGWHPCYLLFVTLVHDRTSLYLLLYLNEDLFLVKLTPRSILTNLLYIY